MGCCFANSFRLRYFGFEYHLEVSFVHLLQRVIVMIWPPSESLFFVIGDFARLCYHELIYNMYKFAIQW